MIPIQKGMSSILIRRSKILLNMASTIKSIKEEAQRKNLMVFDLVLSAIVIFSIGMIIINHKFLNSNIIPYCLFALAAISLIVSIAIFISFFMSDDYKNIDDKTKIFGKSGSIRRTFLLSRNFVLYNSLITVLVICKAVDDTLFLVGKSSVASVILSFLPNVFATLSVIGSVSVFRQSGPFMKNAFVFSMVTVITTGIDIVKAIILKEYTIMFIVLSLVRVILCLINIKCLKWLKNNIDYK